MGIMTRFAFLKSHAETKKKPWNVGINELLKQSRWFHGRKGQLR